MPWILWAFFHPVAETRSSNEMILLENFTKRKFILYTLVLTECLRPPLVCRLTRMNLTTSPRIITAHSPFVIIIFRGISLSVFVVRSKIWWPFLKLTMHENSRSIFEALVVIDYIGITAIVQCDTLVQWNAMFLLEGKQKYIDVITVLCPAY